MAGHFQKIASFARGSIFSILAVAILLVMLPGAIHRLTQTGNLYLFSRHFDDMLGRLSGAGRLRFLLQPTVAILLGSREGLKDAGVGLPPYLWALVFHGGHRRELLRGMLQSTPEIVAVAILLDILSQSLIFREIHPQGSDPARTGADRHAICSISWVRQPHRQKQTFSSIVSTR